MTQHLEAAIENLNASRVETEDNHGRFNSFSSYGEKLIGQEFERNPIVSSYPSGHNRRYEKHKVTDRLHSEKKIRRLIKEELTLADWMRAKLWRLKRRIL